MDVDEGSGQNLDFELCWVVSMGEVPIKTAADDKFYIFLNFRKNKVYYFMRIVWQQKILMKYHAVFVIF